MSKYCLKTAWKNHLSQHDQRLKVHDKAVKVGEHKKEYSLLI